MGKILKNLRARDWILMACCVGLVVLQVWLELTMPDYTAKLMQEVTMAAERGDSTTLSMSVVWKNGGMMLLCAFGSLAAAVLCGFLAAIVAASIARTLRSKLFDRITEFSNAEMEKIGSVV